VFDKLLIDIYGLAFRYIDLVYDQSKDIVALSINKYDTCLVLLHFLFVASWQLVVIIGHYIIFINQNLTLLV
jgi:hypothetical protein